MAKKKAKPDLTKKISEEKLIKARIALMRQEPFFGTLCLHLTMEENDWVPTAGTDGDKFYYNYEFVNSLPENQLLAVLIHEVIHAAMGHIWRRSKREKHRWNFAADYATNWLIQKNGYTLPPGCLISEKYADMNAETIYTKIPPTKFITICPFCGGKIGKSKQKQSEGKGGGQKQNQKKQGKGNGRGKTKGRGQASTPSHKCCSSHVFWDKPGGKQLSPREQKRLERKWKAAVEDAVAKSKGKTPAGFKRMVEELQPKEDWRKILATYLSTSTTDFDFMKRDRRMLGSPFYLPDLGDEEQLENIIFVLDTSGSISSSELNNFVSEVRGLMKYFPRAKGWVMDCDASVGQVFELEKMKQVRHFYGGGGTSHVPVFKEIKKREWNPKVVVCFTDLYTDFPGYTPPYPVLWLVPKNNYSRDKVPFGRIIVMQS